MFSVLLTYISVTGFVTIKLCVKYTLTILQLVYFFIYFFYRTALFNSCRVIAIMRFFTISSITKTSTKRLLFFSLVLYFLTCVDYRFFLFFYVMVNILR